MRDKSTASIGRQFGIFAFDGTREVEKAAHWSFGQAMNTAVTLATQKPDWIVWMETRVVIHESWMDVDYEAEEETQREKAAARIAQEKINEAAALRRVEA